MTNDRRSFGLCMLSTTCILCLSACSALPEDIRASLPEPLRGDTTALADYPTPELSGTWQDTDYPDLTVTLQQTGDEFFIRRTGEHRGMAVDESYRGTLNGRAIKISFSARHAGQIRPIEGECHGVASKDSSALQLTCQSSLKGTFPLNLEKR